MPRQVFEFDPPERFVAGTVGQPGSRTFFLQATGAGRVTSVALEKQQVTVLAEKVEQLLDEVLRRTGGTAPVPAVAPTENVDNAPLDTPILEEFRVGTMALTWDTDTDRVVVEALADTGTTEPARAGEAEAEAGDSDDADTPTLLLPDVDDENGPDLLRVRLTGAMARAFAARAAKVVSAGRPPCPFCGLPLDAEGHICPRQNGYRR